MRLSHLFTKTSKTVPHDADSINAKYLLQAGFVHQEMAGVYSWLPLGLRVLRKVEAIIREEMEALGAQEILMSSLQPKDNWLQTGRWEAVDVLFKIPSQTKKEYALGPTHEEIVTPLVKSFVTSYRGLPLAVYQIQSKFRDELRAKSGVLRGREFAMKDMYSFHASQEDLEKFYAQALEAYLRVFSRCGLKALVVEASGGSFTKKFSHEFQVLTEAGEDLIAMCKCEDAKNSEVTFKLDLKVCSKCGTEFRYEKGVEVGNIFDLGSKFAEAFDFAVTDEAGERRTVFMGCYGIGVSRLVGTIVEASHDERGMIWPKTVAPYHVHLVSLRSKDDTVQSRLNEQALSFYEALTKQGIEVLWDDRAEVSPGEKFADADLIGLPLRLVVSERMLTEEAVEWKERGQGEARAVKEEAVLEGVASFVQS